MNKDTDCLVAVPDGINYRPDDLVSYTCTVEGVEKDYEADICYQKMMPKLAKSSFVCRPVAAQKRSLLPENYYLSWMSLCRDHGLVPADAVASHEGGRNYLTVAKPKARHRAYAALCCYRWAENQPPIPYVTVELCRKRPRLSFWQCLHYACGRYMYWLHHSFTSIGTVRKVGIYNDYGVNPMHNRSLLLSAALRWFFEPVAGGLADSDRHPYSANAINELAVKVGFPIDAPGPFFLDRVEDVLDERYTPLYALAAPPTTAEANKLWATLLAVRPLSAAA